MNKIKKLKGGSLNSTYLMEKDNVRFVRKEVSLIENREYGFQRWYSQLKRLQRYSVLFPGFFPNVLQYGMEEDMAYFDIEYIENSLNGYEYLSKKLTNEDVGKYFDALHRLMDGMYKEKMDSDDQSIELYLREEVFQRLKDAKKNKKFSRFLENKKIIFQGEEIDSLISNIDEYRRIAISSYKNQKETFTHGNLTLENTLYVKEEDRVYFIDPYEENIIDSPLAEYSQLLQSSNSYYEIYNSGKAIISDNNISMDIQIPNSIEIFNMLLKSHLETNYNNDDIITVRILEISQFIRMLPFKSVVDEDKMVFFYGLASKLLSDLIKYKK